MCGLSGFVRQHAVQDGRGQFLGAGGRGVAVEERLRLDHQRPEALAVALLQRLAGLADDALVDRAEQLLHAALQRALGERVRPVQPLEDLEGVLAGVEIDDDEVQVAGRTHLLGAQAVSVELHQHGPIAVRAALVHATAARRRGDLALVGQFHLAAHRELQVVHAVERPRREHADGRARREPLADREVGQRVVDHEAADAVVREHLVGDAGGVREEAALLRLLEQRLRLERNLARADAPPVRGRRGEDERRRMRRHLRVNPLVGAADEGVPLLDVGVDPAVAARPVRVLAEEADAAGDEDLHTGATSCHGAGRPPRIS